MGNHFRKYAGFWLRAKAFALDYIVILAYLIALSVLFLILGRFYKGLQGLFTDRLQAQFVAFLLVTLPVMLYFAVGESSFWQATWGKRQSGLQVTSHDGNRIHILRAFGRTLLKLLPWELSHTLIWQIYFSPGTNSVWINYGFVLVYALIGSNIASVVMTRTHRALYDFLVGTYVMKSSL